MNNNQTDFLNPAFGYRFNDLFDSFKLKQLAEDFDKYFESKDKSKFDAFVKYRISKAKGMSPQDVSSVLIDASLVLSDFIVELFNLQDYQKKFVDKKNYEQDILDFNKDIIQKKVLKKFKENDLENMNWQRLNDFANMIKAEFFNEEDFKRDEEKYTASMMLKLVEVEKHLKWFYEGDKFAPEGFTIPEESMLITEKTIALIKSAGMSEDGEKPEHSELSKLRKILDELFMWLFAKKHFDRNTENWISYFDPEKLDYSHLVKMDETEGMKHAPEGKLVHRSGFKLTDPRMDDRHIAQQANYCMFCHDRDKDSCTKGYKDKTGNIKKNPLGISLNGCPLDEKISEMQFVSNEGFPLAALALIVIDNPNLPGTGHRICNDCMKSCIFQNQEPVNIPQIETSILTDTFKLPYGYEIYSLLTRWNPLNIKFPHELPYNGKNILVVGMGPAGYTLTHHLITEGFGVIGIDGLKIEKVHEKYAGTKDSNGWVNYPEPVKYFYEEIEEDLDKRILQGFGGVSEYGITVRWDKNFLTAIYINIARRKHFRLYDGVRFGGTMDIEDAWDLGFDHIALATGAGKPTIIGMKNNLIRGIRKASDFLMALQLTGAAKEDSFANLQIRLPAIVIGGGLTAIDASTEILAYYPVQVLKALKKYEDIVSEFGEDKFWAMFDEEEKAVMETFLDHAREITDEMNSANSENREPDFVTLMNGWGGVTMAYRKLLIDSPAYRLNHEEIREALKQGINICEGVSPLEAVPDEKGAVKELIFAKQIVTKDAETGRTRYKDSEEMITMPAKTVLVAAGTSPNIVYEREHPGTFLLDTKGYFFREHMIVKDEKGKHILVEAKENETGLFTSYEKNGKFISYYGDNHPDYAGNVVKAMASAQYGYDIVARLFSDEIKSQNYDQDSVTEREKKFSELALHLDEALTATVHSVERLTPTIVEITVHAPYAAKKFRPGQFYRLQNYELTAPVINGAKLTMEGMAMTGAWTDPEKGLLSLIVLEMGVSSRLTELLQKGEKVVVMGPTGEPTHIPENQTVLLAGGGLGNAVLFSIAEALRRRNNKVIYFAGYKDSKDVFKMDEVEAGADQVIWSNDTGEIIMPRRAQDLSFKGNIVEAMKAYSEGTLGNKIGDFKEVSRIITIGSDRMMNAVKVARYTVFKDKFGEHTGIGSINSPMQCMMKEICAQCLQRHVDPVTGKESFVFTCFNQDQDLDRVDFENLHQRLRQNSVLEKLANAYLTFLFSKGEEELTNVEDEDSIMKGH